MNGVVNRARSRALLHSLLIMGPGAVLSGRKELHHGKAEKALTRYPKMEAVPLQRPPLGAHPLGPGRTVPYLQAQTDLSGL